MPLTFALLNQLLEQHTDALGQLETLYHEMDAAYEAATQGYGFACRGCEDNCCLTRFYHHTIVEIAGLLVGYRGLPQNKRTLVLERALKYGLDLQTSERQHRPLRHICPLNTDERCILYPQRPMICRLHGIPHVIHHPARGLITGPGCQMFEASCSQTAGHPLDRTALYSAMAMLEKSLRQASGIQIPVRLTIAEMILIFEDRFDSS